MVQRDISVQDAKVVDLAQRLLCCQRNRGSQLWDCAEKTPCKPAGFDAACRKGALVKEAWCSLAATPQLHAFS